MNAPSLKDRCLSTFPWLGDASEFRSNLPTPIRNYMEIYMDTIPRAINHLLVILMVCNAILFINAIALHHIPNMGFNILIIATLSVIHNAAAWNMFSDSVTGAMGVVDNSEFNVGCMFGLTVGMAVLSFVNAIYFGRLSGCEAMEVNPLRYQCDSKAAMRFVWFFGNLICMLDCALALLIAAGKNDLTIERSQYEDIGMQVEDNGGGGNVRNSFDGDFPSHSHQSLQSTRNSSVRIVV